MPPLTVVFSFVSFVSFTVNSNTEFLHFHFMLVSHSTYQSEMQQKTEPVHEDSDLDRKRRETEALLQSIGISPEPPLGTDNYVLISAMCINIACSTKNGFIV